jgi:uncharacterized membrane protein YphA (DoxX/SURF4 family)
MVTNTDRVHSVQNVLRVIFGVVPIVAGADKFFNLLTNWSQYLNPAFERFLPFTTATFMHIVGVIEIAAGLIVLSPFAAIGAYIVCAWLVAIALSLITSGRFLDVAVRDLVMSAGAWSLAVLSQIRQAESSSAYQESHNRIRTA